MPIIVDKKKKKAAILEASIRIFSRQGLRKTKISDIAEEAGIGKGTIYEYFKSKDEVFAAAFGYFMEKLEGNIAGRLFRIHDPLEKLKAYFDSWMAVLEGEYRDFLEITLDFWAEGIREREESQLINLEHLYTQNIMVLDSLLSECVSKGEIKSIDTRLAASVLLGALDGIMLQMVMFKDSFDGGAAVALFVDTMIEGLRVKE
jgi:AcrR family transcriptional regulator